MSYFSDGIAWLRRKLTNYASETITISRAGILIGEFGAVVAKSESEDVDATGRRVNVYIVDFLISGLTEYRPQKGDEITYNGALYAVRPLGKEIWRFDDPYEELIRIHTQFVA